MGEHRSEGRSETAGAQPVEPPLAGPIRQQLITIAAELLGRTSQAELPVGLRRFARFTPGKRLRMASAELATALAIDSDFRDAVAEIVRDASPELVEQVIAGLPPVTAEPTDVGVVYYLFRPPGWDSALAELTEGLSRQVEHGQAAGELDRLRREVERLSAVNAELVRARDAARVAARQAGAEQAKLVTDLERQVRTLVGEVRAARRQAQSSAEEAATLRAEREREAAAESTELRRARARITTLEGELDAGRRVVRTERDHDDARLWLLLEQLTAAAAGLRRELDLGRPGVSPADVVPTAGPGDGARLSSLDAQLLDRVLDGSHVHLIVDGYNLTKTGYPELTLAEQRNRLVSALGSLAARTRVEITVAFDGTAAPIGAAARLPTPRGVRVLFSATGDLADDLIRTLLSAEPAGRTVVVASSDRAVAASARQAGAWSTTAASLLTRLQRV